MENASKALIIAGAILIAIVLITIGVVILGQGQDVANNSNIDDIKIQQFNNKFEQYTGDKVSGAKVNELLEMIVANNTVARRDGEAGKYISVRVMTNKGSLSFKGYGTVNTSQEDAIQSTDITTVEKGKKRFMLYFDNYKQSSFIRNIQSSYWTY